MNFGMRFDFSYIIKYQNFKKTQFIKKKNNSNLLKNEI